MLKFLDFARLVGAGIKCTACDGTRCRPSQWRSKHERLGSLGLRPYRCDDCDNRFLVARGASLERKLINGAAYAVLGFAVLVAVELWIDGSEVSANKPVKPVATVEAEPDEAEPRPVPVEAGSRADGPATVGKELPEDQMFNVALLQKAASNGHPGAMVRLGQILASGDKHPKDHGQAAKWMQMAAATGNPQGMFELGRYYRDGVGLAPNQVRAYVWFSRAATARHIEAAHERDLLVRTMSEEHLNEAHAQALAEQ